MTTIRLPQWAYIFRFIAKAEQLYKETITQPTVFSLRRTFLASHDESYKHCAWYMFRGRNFHPLTLFFPNRPAWHWQWIRVAILCRIWGIYTLCTRRRISFIFNASLFPFHNVTQVFRYWNLFIEIESNRISPSVELFTVIAVGDWIMWNTGFRYRRLLVQVFWRESTFCEFLKKLRGNSFTAMKNYVLNRIFLVYFLFDESPFPNSFIGAKLLRFLFLKHIIIMILDFLI